MERAASWQVEDVRDDREIFSLLNRDRIWSAYAICDLDTPYRQFARFVGAWCQGELLAGALFYVAPGFSTVLPCGSHIGVRAVMEKVGELPPSLSLSVRPGDLSSVVLRYRLQRFRVMRRMIVHAGEEQLVLATGAQVRRLTFDDLPLLAAWYAREENAVFSRFIFENGVYMGALQDGELVAVAGTHAISQRYRIAAVGGVYTEPAFRGRGLAMATTSAVVQALIGQGIVDIVLNVREDNAPAIAAYTRLGFQMYGRFWEGEAELRA